MKRSSLFSITAAVLLLVSSLFISITSASVETNFDAHQAGLNFAAEELSAQILSSTFRQSSKINSLAWSRIKQLVSPLITASNSIRTTTLPDSVAANREFVVRIQNVVDLLEATILGANADVTSMADKSKVVIDKGIEFSSKLRDSSVAASTKLTYLRVIDVAIDTMENAAKTTFEAIQDLIAVQSGKIAKELAAMSTINTSLLKGAGDPMITKVSETLKTLQGPLAQEVSRQKNAIRKMDRMLRDNFQNVVRNFPGYDPNRDSNSNDTDSGSNAQQPQFGGDVNLDTAPTVSELTNKILSDVGLIRQVRQILRNSSLVGTLEHASDLVRTEKLLPFTDLDKVESFKNLRLEAMCSAANHFNTTLQIAARTIATRENLCALINGTTTTSTTSTTTRLCLTDLIANGLPSNAVKLSYGLPWSVCDESESLCLQLNKDTTCNYCLAAADYLALNIGTGVPCVSLVSTICGDDAQQRQSEDTVRSVLCRAAREQICPYAWANIKEKGSFESCRSKNACY
eukprot:GEZU01032480.1.p1 GENE.GEZU01032480.1~~GEZU01032480.1.p1  ORF type:complete len:540 (-),score=127.14 GEZU01032480.1:747-2294(-)